MSTKFDILNAQTKRENNCGKDPVTIATTNSIKGWSYLAHLNNETYKANNGQHRPQLHK